MRLVLKIVLIPIVSSAALRLHAAPLPPGSIFPAPGAKDVPADVNLKITLPSAPVVGSAGKIHVIDVSNDAEVAVVDVASQIGTQKIGGVGDFHYHTILIDDKQATIVLPSHALAYGKTYCVKMDDGAFKEVDGISDAKTWQFTTRNASPKGAKLTVAADGTGDFCTVQGAIDSLPDGNNTPTTLFVRKGTYTEIVAFTNKNHITLLGEGRKQTVIAYANNERFNLIQGNPFGGDHPDPSSFDPAKGEPVYHRGVINGHRVSDLTIANLTLHNTTPQGGSQAEAIILNGTTSARAILKDVDLYSYQDTLQINGQAYLSNCYIEGDTDFMWGTGPVVFENCHLTSKRSRTFYTQIRNQPTNHGFVYLRCRFDGSDGVADSFLSRIATGKYPASEVVLIDCIQTAAVSKAAWQVQGGAADVRFWEFNSHDPDGKPVDVSGRHAASKQLKQAEDAATIANYSDPKFVLGNDWNPKSDPIFSVSPSR